jgi:hypothetical protein
LFAPTVRMRRSAVTREPRTPPGWGRDSLARRDRRCSR